MQLLGHDVSYHAVQAALPAAAHGVSLAEIQTASTKLGLELELRKDVAPDELTSDSLPAIVHLRTLPSSNSTPENHFTVIYLNYGNAYGGFDTANMQFATYGVNSLARNMTGYVAFPKSRPNVVGTMNRRLFLLVSFVTGCTMVWHASAYCRGRRGHIKKVR